MICPRCHARNSPAADFCHSCEEELPRDFEPPRASPSTWRAPRQWVLGALAALLLMGAAIGGDWLGDWFVRNPSAQAPRADGVVLAERYERWKQAHALPVEDMMELYAPEARIVNGLGQPRQSFPLSELRHLAVMARRDGLFNSASDVVAPRISHDGDRATISAQHRYGHSNSTLPTNLGDRVLIWERRGATWLVVEDHFPNSYKPER